MPAKIIATRIFTQTVQCPAVNTDTHRRRFATRNLAYIMQILQRTHTLIKFKKINNNHVQYKTECAPADGEATLSKLF